MVKYACLIFASYLLLLSGHIAAQEKFYLVSKETYEKLEGRNKSIADSILKIYHDTPNDTTKIKHLDVLVELITSYEIVPEYNQVILSQSLKALSKPGLKPTELSFYDFAAGKCYGRKGYYMIRKNQFREAWHYQSKAEQILLRYGATPHLALLYSDMGFVANITGNTAEGIRLFFKAHEIAEKTKDKILIAKTLADIAIIHLDLNEKEKAENYLKKSLQASSEVKNTSEPQHIENICRAYSYFAQEHILKKEFGAALNYYNRSLAAINNNENIGAYAETLCQIGNLYYKKNLPDSAMMFFMKVIQLPEEKTEAIIKAETYNGILRCFTMKKDYVIGEKYLTEYKDFVFNTLGPADIRSFAASAQEFYTKTNRYKDALEMSILYREMNDSILNDRIKNEAYKSAAEKEFREKENALIISQKAKEAREEEKNKYKTLIITISISIIVVTLLLLIVTAVSLKRNKRNSKIISKSLVEKELLLKEIHHRVKNNLQVISSLLDLQSGDIKDAKTKEALDESQSRIGSISIIHHQLYQHEGLNAVEMHKFATELLSQVSGIYKKTDEVVETSIHIPETLIEIDSIVPLGLILNEMLTNSFKYAFSSEKPGHIYMSLEKNGSDNGTSYYTFVYRDNGPGLSSFIDLKKVNTLGLKLIMKLSKQIGGTTSYQFNGGAQFTIKFSSGTL